MSPSERAGMLFVVAARLISVPIRDCQEPGAAGDGQGLPGGCPPDWDQWPLVCLTTLADAEGMDIQPPLTCLEMNQQAPAPEPLTDDRLAALAKAMSNPNRVKIVRYLSQCRPHIESDIVAETGLAQSTISEHIRALRDVGIVTVVDDPPRIWYCVNRATLVSLAAAIADLPVPFDLTDTVPMAPI